MKNFRLSGIRFSVRAVLLLGVFAGLLFSCGEGIRLFPFPPAAAQTAHGGGSPQLKSGGRVGYEKNLHRFENGQKNQAKFQPRKPPPPSFENYWACAGGGLNRSAFDAAAAWPRLAGTKFFAAARVYKSFISPASRSGRAPPFTAFAQLF